MNEYSQDRWAGRLEGENRMAVLAAEITRRGDGQLLEILAHDKTGMRRARAYHEYEIPDYGQTELDEEIREVREQEQARLEAEADAMLAGEDEDEPQEPIGFEITNPEDLEKIRVFKKQHRRCKYIHHDMTAAWLTYSVTPTGFGPIYGVECSCGEKISLGADWG